MLYWEYLQGKEGVRYVGCAEAGRVGDCLSGRLRRAVEDLEDLEDPGATNTPTHQILIES